MSSMLHLIDEQSALDALSGDRQLLSEVATIFVEDVPKLLENLEKAVTSRDFDTACRTMHGLRGLASALYSKALTDLTYQLEQDLKVGSAKSLEKGGLSELKCSTENLTKELRDAGYAK